MHKRSQRACRRGYSGDGNLVDYPFLAGFLILATVAAIGYGAERSAWAKPAAVLATLALIGYGAAQLLR